jgi:hypothetical protein
MAYQNVNYPTPKLIHGIKKGVFKPTIIVSNGYSEYRLQRQSALRYRWTIPGTIMNTSDINALTTFLSGINIGLDSFNFTCPKDGISYKVRFDGAGIETVFEALNSSNVPVIESIGDIVLVQVFGE